MPHLHLRLTSTPTPFKALPPLAVALVMTTLMALLASLALMLIMNVAQASPTGVIRYAMPAGLKSGGCLAWANACELSYALSIANAGDEIWVAQGVYKPTGSGRAATFLLKSNVALYGGFTGVETLRTERDWAAHVVTLTGDLNDNGLDELDSYHVVRGDWVNQTAILDGFTVTGGNASGVGTESEERGGGMINRSGSPTVRNTRFTGNVATEAGGGMYNENSTAVLHNLTFISNTTEGEGGGMANWNSHGMVISETLFITNTASSGGGMHNESSSPELTHVIFEDNWADAGGGLSNWNSSSPIVSVVTFRRNTAYVGGGVYSYWDSNPRIVNTTFISNSAEMGGGLYNDTGSNALLVNVVFSMNWAETGGAVQSDNSALALTNVTLSGNTASAGSALAADHNSRSVMINSIVWGNSSPGITNNDAVITVSHSLLQESCDTTMVCLAGMLISVDPAFINAEKGGLRPRTGSPVIDAGDNSALLAGINTDLGGTARRTNVAGAPDTGYGTPPIVDMGAYEAYRSDVAVTLGTRHTGVAPGRAITLVVTFSNAGSLPAMGVLITDIVPLGISAAPFEATSRGVIITPTIDSYVWEVQDMEPGEGGVITLTAAAKTNWGSLPQIFTNTARIGSLSPDGDERNDAASRIVAVVDPDASFMITSTPILGRVGQPITFTTHVSGGVAGVVTPTGVITLTIDSSAVRLPLDPSGRATYVINTLALGTHPVVADYSGDNIFNASTTELTGGQVVSDTPISDLVMVNSGTSIEGYATTFTTTAWGSNVIYTWDWGDTSTDQRPAKASGLFATDTITHTYTTAGMYTATVTATNSVGAVVTTSTLQVVHVTPRVFVPFVSVYRLVLQPRVFVPLVVNDMP